MDLAGPGACVLYGAALHRCDLARNTNHDARMHQAAVPVGLPDEMVQHVRRGFEVRDYTVLHGLDGGDLLRCAAEHLSGLGAHRFYAPGILAHRDDGRLVDYDTLVSLEHECVGCTKIDCEIRTEQAAKGWCGHIRCR